MTNDTLRTLVRDDATTGEPPFTLTPDAALQQGRNRLRTRRLVAGAACLAVLGLGAATVPHLTGPVGPAGRGDRSGLDAATQDALDSYDARRMAQRLDDTVRSQVRRVSAPFDTGAVRAYDSQDQKLPAQYLDRASSWRGDYAWGLDHTFVVNLIYSRSEAEGDPAQQCREGLAEGYDLACEVTRTDTGRPVVTTVSPVRAGTQERVAGQPSLSAVRNWRRVDPDRLWFVRAVEVRRGGTFVTVATESVQARSPQAAEEQWNVDVDTMTSIASAPDLVFPAPTKDANGCDFTLPGTGYDCTATVPMEPDAG